MEKHKIKSLEQRIMVGALEHEPDISRQQPIASWRPEWGSVSTSIDVSKLLGSN